MKFKFQQSVIEMLSKTSSESPVKIVFSFQNEILPNAKSIAKTISIPKINDISALGSIAIINNDTNYIILSLGNKSQLNIAGYFKALQSLSRFIKDSKKLAETDIILEDSVAKVLNVEFNHYAEQTVFHIINNLYYFDELKIQRNKLGLKNLNIIHKQNLTTIVNNAASLLEGSFLLQDLGNKPGNIVTPTYLANTALSFEKISKKVKVHILNEKEIQKLQMNCFYSVGKGSNEESKFIVMEYKGAKSNKKPIVLVGKGVTFDTGGIWIKPGPNMSNQKLDMCGAASVIGTFLSVVKLALPINLVVAVPTCENMPSGTAVKPGDVIKSMSGQTVEILNTDAEGRLILCDALHYVKKFKPELVIDVATLTSGCIIALGGAASGLFSNDDNLVKEIVASSHNTADKVWQLPIFDEYLDDIKSEVADMANIGKSSTGLASTAAGFLSKFVDYKWAHLDVAGTAVRSGSFGTNVATGRPFNLLIDFLRNHK